jgi:DNA-binding transcriptional ArsR family regulator
VPPAAPTPTPLPGVSVQVAGEDVSVVIGTRTYRVRGLARNRTSDVLRVNLRLSVASAAAGAAASTAGERFHVDSLDLYQTRFRQAFIAAAAAETGLAADVVKADLGKLLLALECHQADERRRGSAAASPAGGSATSPAADPAATMPPEAREAALSFLSAPDLCQRIQADLDTCGLVGEATNKLVAYLAATSRKLDSPLAVVVQSSSAAGKSTLMDKVLSLMPPEEVRQYSAISGKSPFYLGTDNLKHRILAVAEEEGARRASYALKLLQSDGHLSMAATGKDPESGKLVTHDYRVEGPVMLMLTTTAIDVDPELMNRCLVLTVDEGASQTAAIQAAQRTSRTLEGLAAKRDRAGVVALHRNAQRLLRPLAVVNPLAPSLSFGSTQTRLRRDHAKYLALIDAVAFLHQYQRPLREHRFPDGTVLPYIEATAADVALAERLARVVLARSLDDLPPQTRRFLGQVHAWATTAAGSAGQALERFAFTRRQAREGTGLGQTQTRMHLDRLVEHELVEVLRPGGDGLAPRYRLAWEPTAAGDAAAPLGPPGAGPAVPPTPSTEESPHTPMMAACRGLSGVVGGMSESIPTGSMTVEYSACSENDGACRGAAVAQGRGFNSSGIVTYMHEPPAQPEPQAVAV